jgi:membrane protein
VGGLLRRQAAGRVTAVRYPAQSVIGPAVAAARRSRPVRTYLHFTAVRGNRLAGAVTFFGFLAVFPLLTVALAVAVAVLSDARVAQLERKLAHEVPGLAGSIDVSGLVANAATIGAVSAVVLLASGLGWVDTLRGSIRDVWQLPQDRANFVVRKLWDCAVLAGLGLVAAVSLGASTLAAVLSGRAAGWLGLSRSGPGGYLLALVGYLVAIGTDMLLFGYLLGPFPRITGQRRRDLLQGALIGSVGFELLKIALSSYLGRVAGKSVYGAFGVPVALLLWIDFVSRLLLYCVAWTALADPVAARTRARAQALAVLAEDGEPSAQVAGEKAKKS